MIDVEVSEKEEILNILIDALNAKVPEDTLWEIKDAVFEREKIMSTGVGKGLAIPHGKVSNLKNNYAAFAKLAQPVDYDAIDDKPVELLFLLIGPKSSNSLHIKLLSRISRLMNNEVFRKKLLECSSPEEFLEVFRSEEQKNFGTVT